MPWWAWLLVAWAAASVLLLVWNAGAHRRPTPRVSDGLDDEWVRLEEDQ